MNLHSLPNQPPIKIPTDILSISERKTVDLMNLALAGNNQAIKQVKAVLSLAPVYQKIGVGAPYFASPHLASKQIIIWNVIGAFSGNNDFLNELRYMKRYGANIDFQTGRVLDKNMVIDNYMSFFILTNEEEDYYKTLLKKNPNDLYANYLLYMNARERKTSDVTLYLKKIQYIIDEKLLFGDLTYDSATKELKVVVLHK